MGALKALFLASAAVVGLASFAHAADLLPPAPQMEPPPMAAPEFSGWYLRGDVGMAVASGNAGVGISPNPLVGLPADAYNSFYNASLSASALFDVGVGYQINNWLRFDVTGEYRGGGQFQTLEQVGVPSLAQQYGDFYRGNVSSVIGLVNGYVDIGTWYGVSPFIGAGVGFANVETTGLQDSGSKYTVANGAVGGASYFASGASTTNFAWAAHAGVAYKVTNNFTIELAYRYLDMGTAGHGYGQSFDGSNAGPSSFKFRDLTSQDLRIGVRWTCCDLPPPPPPLIRKG